MEEEEGAAIFPVSVLSKEEGARRDVFVSLENEIPSYCSSL